MKKKKTVIAVIAAALVLITLIILFVPFSTSHYDDGGTTEYRALTYTVVKWQRVGGTSNGTEYISGLYTGTRVHRFADGYKSVDELWEEDKDSLTLMDG